MSLCRMALMTPSAGGVRACGNPAIYDDFCRECCGRVVSMYREQLRNVERQAADYRGHITKYLVAMGEPPPGMCRCSNHEEHPRAYGCPKET